MYGIEFQKVYISIMSINLILFTLTTNCKVITPHNEIAIITRPQSIFI